MAARVASAGARALGAIDAADRTVTAHAAEQREAATEARVRQSRDASARAAAVASRARTALSRSVDALAPGAAGADWAASSMRPTTDLMAVASHVRLGRVLVPGHPEVPLLVPLLDRGNLLLRTGTSDDRVLGVVHGVAGRALLATGPGQLTLHGFDPELRGLLSPFAALRGAGSALLTGVGTTGDDLAGLLDRIAEDVRRVNDLRRGRTVTLGGLRAAARQPVETFQLVVIVDYPRSVTPATAAVLNALLRSGPACGVSFLIQHNVAVVPEEGVDPDDLPRVSEVITLAETTSWSRLPGVDVALDPVPAARVFVGAVDAVATAAERIAAPQLGLAEILGNPTLGQRSSADGISVPVGRAGTETVEIMLGDERGQRHNLLVTGAVGQGKSNFLKVFVHGLAARYPAREVCLYLLDLKEGVTFYPLAATPDSPDWLPQAGVIGLESDREFAVAVLESLYEEFERRAAVIKPYGDKISTYRSRVPGAVMPRLILVVDEFQMLFAEDDAIGDRALRLVERLARQGRAYGIHLLLASQTISGITTMLGKQDGVYSQFPIRVAFKNSAGESRAVLDQDNPDAASLRYRGEAILNIEYGRRDANRRITVAAAVEEDLNRVRRTEWARRPAGSTPPQVFEGGRPALLTSATEQLRRLREHAGRRPYAGRVGLVGVAIALPLQADGPVFAREAGRHLAIIGAGNRRSPRQSGGTGNLAAGAMQAAAISLALQHPSGDAAFTLLDLLNPDESVESGMSELGWLLERLGFPLRVAGADEVDDELRLIAAGLPDRPPDAGAHYVLAPALDRAGALSRADESLVTGLDALQAILRDGPVRHTHLLAWWSSVGMYRTHLGFDASVEIDAMLALRVSQRDIVDLMGHTVTWNPRDNRGLLHDRHEFPEPLTVIPMAPLTRATAQALLRTDWDPS